MKTFFIIWCIFVFVMLQVIFVYIGDVIHVSETNMRIAACVLYIYFLIKSAYGYFIGVIIERFLDR